METSNWINVALAIVATGAAIVAWLAYIDSRRTNRGTLKALGDERDARTHELDLLGQQVELLRTQVAGEAQDRAAQSAADIHVERGGRDGLGYSFVLTNAGPAAATRVMGWLASARSPNEPVSSIAQVPGVQLAGARSERLRVSLTESQVQERPACSRALMA